MEDFKSDKTARILGLYTKLINGQVINKTKEAQNSGVNERSIQRDIDDIRNFLEDETVNTGIVNSVIYDREKKGYRLEQAEKMNLSNSEILAICKILIDSRAFPKAEMYSLLDRLVMCCVPKPNQALVSKLIENEKFHYIEPRHRTAFLDNMWNIGQARYRSKIPQQDNFHRRITPSFDDIF